MRGHFGAYRIEGATIPIDARETNHGGGNLKGVAFGWRFSATNSGIFLTVDFMGVEMPVRVTHLNGKHLTSLTAKDARKLGPEVASDYAIHVRTSGEIPDEFRA
jgi:hypothetical protein